MTQCIFTNLTSGTATSTSTPSTSSVSPTNRQVMLVSIGNVVSSGTPNTPSLALSGWVFNQVATVNFNSTRRITLFTAIGSGSGTIAITFSGQSQTVVGWTVDQVANSKISGTGGADAVVQHGQFSSGSATSYAITLSAFANVNNATYSVVAKDATNNVIPNAGFTELAETTHSSPNWDNESMSSAVNQTSVGATFSGSGGDSAGAIAVEIAFLTNFLGGMI